MLVRPTVHAVVRRVQTAFREPLDVASLESACADGVEWTMPVQGFASHLPITEHTFRISRRIGAGELEVERKREILHTLAHHLSDS